MAPDSSNPIEVVSVSRKQRRGEFGSGIEHVSRRAAVQPVRDLDSAGDDSMPNCTGCNQSSPAIQLFADELSYEGGALASGAAIQLIFWGSVWNDPTTSPRPGEIIAAVQNLVDSAYFFPLKQYGVDPGPLGKSLIVTSPSPGGVVSSGDITSLLWDLIGDKFPEPDEPGGHNIHVVFLPPNTGLPDPTEESAHGSTWHIVLPKVHTAWYVWIDCTGGLEATTTNLSHELVEAYTDPEPNSGWVVNGGADSALSEIGDICEQVPASTVNGVMVKFYFSRFNNACIIPCGLSVRMLLQFKGIDGALGIRAHLPPGACLREFLTS